MEFGQPRCAEAQAVIAHEEKKLRADAQGKRAGKAADERAIFVHDFERPAAH